MVLATLPKREICGAADGLDLPVVPNPHGQFPLSLLAVQSRSFRPDIGRWGPFKSPSDPTLVTCEYKFVSCAGG